ncbi:Hypothetical predicted protein [Olea europaea subsp. europaea]|uniref:Transmembrane protein n=1 Tax=Olea europaea subsp. europaea TaxID=158383 RepID=A0A8S0TJQ3_OLEEU|nr:Hypothetical predicted protein [Olea europaea subsp. europaea]
MNSSTKPLFFFFVLLISIALNSHVSSQSEEPSLKLPTDASLEWPMGMSFYESDFGEFNEEGQEDDLGAEPTSSEGARSRMLAPPKSVEPSGNVTSGVADGRLEKKKVETLKPV